MPPGKLASQTGHAFLEAYRQASEERRNIFHSQGLGTKIVVSVRSEHKLIRLKSSLDQKRLPNALITDTGNNTTFGGVPTVSALGVGPLSPEEAQLLKRCKLVT
jgi:peptidyl-tRNA hydrolase